MSDPEIGSWWQKISTGAVYKIVCITNLLKNPDPRFPPTVVYRTHKGEFLSQPVESFMAGQYKKVADAKKEE